MDSRAIFAVLTVATILVVTSGSQGQDSDWLESKPLFDLDETVRFSTQDKLALFEIVGYVRYKQKNANDNSSKWLYKPVGVNPEISTITAYATTQIILKAPGLNISLDHETYAGSIRDIRMNVTLQDQSLAKCYIENMYNFPSNLKDRLYYKCTEFRAYSCSESHSNLTLVLEKFILQINNESEGEIEDQKYSKYNYFCFVPQ